MGSFFDLFNRDASSGSLQHQSCTMRSKNFLKASLVSGDSNPPKALLASNPGKSPRRTRQILVSFRGDRWLKICTSVKFSGSVTRVSDVTQ